MDYFSNHTWRWEKRHERRSLPKMKPLGLSVNFNDLEISWAGPFSWWLCASPLLNSFDSKEENGKGRDGKDLALLCFYISLSSCRLVLLLSVCFMLLTGDTMFFYNFLTLCYVHCVNQMEGTDVKQCKLNH